MSRIAAMFGSFVLVMGACSTTGTEPASSSSATAPATSTTTTTTITGGVGSASIADRTAADEVIYFVMTDRFANGDSDNDSGGSGDDDPLVTGFLPSDKGFFHGGDISGLTARLDYLQELGVTAIWMTPPFTNRAVQGGGEVGNSSAGYHGYWIVDFETVDPHLGTNEELAGFVAAAHERGMKVFLDIVTNHTADVISYAETGVCYRSVKFAPYKDAAGNVFDTADYVGGSEFPELDPASSFPYTPIFASESDADMKRPAWLNNPIFYHNRGNTTFVGENVQLGDFSGLDDLFTEHPEVVTGLIDIYEGVIDEFDIDGFRVDTAKHVNDEFWLAFIPAITQYARLAGKEDFFVYGEVSGSDPIFNSRYTSTIGFPSVLDFGFSAAATTFAGGRAGSKVVADHFDDDDWFTDADSDAHSLVTFLGNHDMGRLGSFVRSGRPTATDAELLRRAELALGLLFFSRGVPTIYYGDEQGFVGDGGDKDARQDMFPSLVDSYNDDDLIGTGATTADDNFDPTHPLYTHIRDLVALRSAYPALQSGAQVTLYSQVDEGILAFSRTDRNELVEYVVVLNNDVTTQSVEMQVATPDARFEQLYPTGGQVLVSDSEGELAVTADPFDVLVYRADRPLPATELAPMVSLVRPAAGSIVDLPRFRLEAAATATGYGEMAFWAQVDGGEALFLGTDDAAPYRIYWDSTPYPTGARVELTVVFDDRRGGTARATVEFQLGDRG